MDFLAIVIDVGSHMRDGENYASSLNHGINIVKRLIQKKLFSESKDEVALIFCGSLETENNLNTSDVDYYKNILIKRNLSKINWKFLEDLNEVNQNDFSESGDLLQAIVVAADHLVSTLRNRTVKGTKRIIALSNLEAKIDFTQLDSICEGLSKENIELHVISERELRDPNNDDDQNGSGDRPSTSDNRRESLSLDKLTQIRLANERDLFKIISRLNGTTYAFDDALLSLNFFETKSTRSTGWKVNLEISDICHIPVIGYIKTQRAKTQTLKLRYGGDTDAELEKRTVHHLQDGKNTSVEANDTIKGFRYGDIVVPCNDEDVRSMKLEVEKSLKLIGFCEDANVPRHLFIGDSSMIFVSGDPNSDTVFASLARALHECEMVALVRRVYSCASSPCLAVLSPIITNASLYLTYNQIAFGEDIRSYTFPSLPCSSSISNDVKKTSTISQDQLNAVDTLIDELMLVKKNPDNDKETEIYKPSKTVSPSIQMFYQSVSHKYFHAHEKLPELDNAIMATLQPPIENQEALESCIDAIKSLFPLKTNENNLKSKKKVSDIIPHENGSCKRSKIATDNDHPLTVGDILTSTVVEVGDASPIEDFRNLLSRGKVSIAMDGMQTVIWNLINTSYLDTLYAKVIVCLRELRTAAIDHSSADANLITQFNEFLINMKKNLLVSSLKSNFWNLLKKENIHLIGLSESDYGCSDQDNVDYLDNNVTSTGVVEQKEEEMDTLFDDM